MKKILLLTLLLIFSVALFSEERKAKYKFEENGKYGILDNNGNVMIPAKYDMIGWLKYGIMPAVKNNYFVFIKENGETIDKKFCSLWSDAPFKKAEHALIPVLDCKTRKWGVINNKGSYIVNPLYDKTYPAKNNIVLANKNNNAYYFDIAGNLLFNFSNVKEAYSFENGYSKIEFDNKEGLFYVDLKGNLYKEKPKIENEKRFEVQKEESVEIPKKLFTGKCEYKRIDEKEQKTIVIKDYDNVISTGEKDLFVVEKNKKFALFKNGSLITELKYDKIKPPHPWGEYYPIFHVSINNKKGVINSKGKKFVPVEYDEICEFIDGETFALKGNRAVIVDLTGKVILAKKATAFKDNNGKVSYVIPFSALKYGKEPCMVGIAPFDHDSWRNVLKFLSN